MLKLEKFKNKELKALEEIKGGGKIYLLYTDNQGVTNSYVLTGPDWEGYYDNNDCIDDFSRVNPRDIQTFESVEALRETVNNNN